MFTWALQEPRICHCLMIKFLLDNNWKHREQQAFVKYSLPLEATGPT